MESVSKSQRLSTATLKAMERKKKAQYPLNVNLFIEGFFAQIVRGFWA